MSSPWFKDGLRFSCTQCGNCCTGEPGFVWVNEDEIQAIADYLGEEFEQAKAYYTRAVGHERTLREKANGDCIFYDRASGCTIYSLRPRQCRTWPFWERNVETPKAWEKTCAGCPGAGKGELIPVEEITRRLKVIPL